MSKYHVRENGEPGLCSASTRACPRGGPEQHFPTEEAARLAYEAENGAIPPASHRRTESSAVDTMGVGELREMLIETRARTAELESKGELTDADSKELDALYSDAELFFMGWVGARQRELEAEKLTRQEVAAKLKAAQEHGKALRLARDPSWLLDPAVEEYALTNLRDSMRTAGA